jgi:hypothetical protein
MKAFRRRNARQSVIPRDQQESAFTLILRDLVERVAGAQAAALVDLDGEAVDYAGRLDPFTLKLAAAHWRIVVHELAALPDRPQVRWLWVRTARSSYLMNALPDGYALALVLARGGGFGGWHRAMDTCARALGDEAGWTWAGALPPRWFPVEVTADSHRRPVSTRSEGGPRTIDVLGSVAGGLGRGERAWRVRYESGVEATLVREPGGLWYSDEPPEPNPAPAA